ADTDMAGIMHFANFFRLMEVTEHAFFRSLGFSVHMEIAGQVLGWPRVRAACEYKHPLRFEDEVEVHLLVREKKERSLMYEFVFRKLDPVLESARGFITVVCVTVDEQTGKMKAVPIPEAIASRIEVAPPECCESGKET
ncbi:MAG TPA: thioesterase family protein, partial [Chthonomonadales bacterium]|nr:thioesterase family protein [Chthonomonadales bacterium]